MLNVGGSQHRACHTAQKRKASSSLPSPVCICTFILLLVHRISRSALFYTELFRNAEKLVVLIQKNFPILRASYSKTSPSYPFHFSLSQGHCPNQNTPFIVGADLPVSILVTGLSQLCPLAALTLQAGPVLLRLHTRVWAVTQEPIGGLSQPGRTYPFQINKEYLRWTISSLLSSK